jgi:hypothetical protein
LIQIFDSLLVALIRLNFELQSAIESREHHDHLIDFPTAEFGLGSDWNCTKNWKWESTHPVIATPPSNQLPRRPNSPSIFPADKFRTANLKYFH